MNLNDERLHEVAAQERLDRSRNAATSRHDSGYYAISTGDIAKSLAIIYLADVLREALVKP